jgi:hypothetical protein
MNDKTITRRGFVSAAAVAVPVAAIFASRDAAAQAAKPKLDVNDPVAKALMYVEDAAKVDKAKAPNFKPGQNCANCAQVPAGSTGDWLGCNAFPGKLVAAKGWCSAWVAKPA